MDKYRRSIAALTAERAELHEENAKLRKRTIALEQEMAMMRARASWMARTTRRTVGPSATLGHPAGPSAPSATARPRSGHPETNRSATTARPATAKSTALPPVGSKATVNQILQAVEAARLEAAAAENDDAIADASEAWTVVGWLKGLDVMQVLADALLRPVGVASSAAGQSWRLELGFVRALAGTSNPIEVFSELLRGDGQLIGLLADMLCTASRSLVASGGSACPVELHAKFMQDHDAFTLDFGGLATYYGGLDGLIGAPQPNLRDAMNREHTKAADSQALFEAANYGTQTTPEIEYHFVLCPERGLGVLKLGNWPGETRLIASLRRAPRTLSSFKLELSKANARLKKLECAPVSEDEVLAARLYTGPLFQKYNSVLRGRKSKSSKMFAKWYASCRGNQYTTTLHVINSAIAKLSQLTVATTVWRGVYGGVLPRDFWRPNEYNVRGGVEWAFLSCTTDYKVAFTYASSGSGPGIVFEFQQGMVDRGADLSWCSQYPHEREILFAPLSTLEILTTRVEGATLIISARLGVNVTDGMTDKVISRRMKMLWEMAQGMQGEVSAAAALHAPDSAGSGASSGSNNSGASFARLSVERFNKLLREGPLSAEASAYNDDDAFSEAIKQIIELKREICEVVRMLPPLAPQISLAGWSLKSSQRVGTFCVWLLAEPAAKSIDLRQCEVPLEGVARIGAALRSNRTIERVIVPREASLPVQEASGNKPTAALDLTRCKLGAVAGCILAELVAFNSCIEKLHLDHNMLGQRNDAACLAIADALRARPTRLRALTLRANYIGGEGALALVSATAQNALLTLLDLRDNEIGGDAVPKLVEHLGEANTADTRAANAGAVSGTATKLFGLRSLRLKGNPIDSQGVALLRVELGRTCPALCVDI